MKKVISFSVYGQDKKYTVGLLRNLELSSKIYPDWTVYVYYNNTVPLDMIEKYKQFDNVEFFDMSGFPGPGVLWRFTPKEDVERFISRDTDSRLSMREKLAVDEWIKSGKTLHIMRDHPHHEVKMYAGLFGLVVSDDLNLKEDILQFLYDDSKEDRELFNKYIDTPFLNKYVYDRYLIDQDLICHDSCFRHFPCSISFPTTLEDYRFIGEIFDENENRYPQYREWINRREIIR